MKDTDYTYAVAYIKTLENKMLSKNDIEALLSAQTVKDCFKLLMDKGYGLRDEKSVTFEELLKKEQKKVWDAVKEACPEGVPLEILFYKNDFHNLKTILKATISKVNWENLIFKPCIADPRELADAIKSANFENLPAFIKNSAKTSYEIIIKTNDAQMMEIYLDKVELLKMREKSIKEKNEFLIGWADLNILIANMKTAARTVGRAKSFIQEAMVETSLSNAKGLCGASQKSIEAVVDEIVKMGYPDGAKCLSESFLNFEKWCNNLKIKYIKKAKNMNFGIEPIFAFLMLKEFELLAVRIIMSGKQNGVDTEIIKERLGDIYV